MAEHVHLTKTYINALKSGAKPYEVRDDEVLGLLLRVQPSGWKTFYLTYLRPDSTRTRTKIGPYPGVTPELARTTANKLLGRLAEGRDPQKEKVTARNERRREDRVGTLKVYIEKEYGPWVESHRGSGAATVARLRACFEADLGAKKLADITPWVVDKWRQQRLKAGMKPSTVNRDLTTLRAALSKAVEWEFVDRHPMAKIKRLKEAESGKPRFLSADEERRLRAALEQSPPYMRVMVALALNTGLRRGELFRLTWSNIDLDRAQLTVIGATAKSGKTRHIPLNTEAVAVLRWWREQQSDGAKLVFIGRFGDTMVEVGRSWQALLDRAKIKNFRFHDCRHHFASWLVMRGADLRTVQSLLGHSSLVMTQKYAHLAPEHRASAVELLVKAPEGRQKTG